MGWYMFRSTHRCIFVVLMVCAVASSQAFSVSAHGGPPRVEVGAPQATAGEPLEVRGVNLGADLDVTVTLVRDNAAIPLGNAICDGQGDFTAFYTLPRNLAVGLYTVRAVNSSDLVVETHLEIEGVLSYTRLQRWIATLPGISWPLVLGILAGLLAIVALVLRRKESQQPVNEG